MSVFVVSDRHIDALLSFARAKNVTVYHGGTLKLCALADTALMGEILLDANWRSYTTYYPRERKPDARPDQFQPNDVRGYQYREPKAEFHPVHVLKGIRCLRYQLGAIDPETIAARILTEIERAAVESLDGYDQAPWSID